MIVATSDWERIHAKDVEALLGRSGLLPLNPVARFAGTMTGRGIPEPQAFFDGEAARQTLLARLPAALRSQHSDDLAFCFLPIGLLSGPTSVLATLRDQGARTTALA